jgi:hypothetical protein
MNSALKRKAFLGIWRFMIPLPQSMIKKDIRGMAKAICRNTAHISENDRKVHRFVVMTMTKTNNPVSPEYIAEKLEMTLDRVKDIIDKLEELKVFFYRYNNHGINWAYPVTAEKQIHKMVFSTGEQCNAA